jgi:hypothetical protein
MFTYMNNYIMKFVNYGCLLYSNADKVTSVVMVIVFVSQTAGLFVKHIYHEKLTRTHCISPEIYWEMSQKFKQKYTHSHYVSQVELLLNLREQMLDEGI